MRFLQSSIVSTTLLISTAVAYPPLPAVPIQFCQVDTERLSDQCLAISSYKNSTTLKKDLSLQISARFFENRNGWAAFGVGKKMDSALMFVMYPGVNDGDVTFAVRSTFGHIPPKVTTAVPDIRVINKWVDSTGIHNTQLICYDCESWTGSKLDVTSTEQSWLWSNHYHMKTQSSNPNLALVLHTDYGIVTLNMATSYSAGEETMATVSKDRVTTSHALAHEAGGHAHKHSAFGIVAMHGFLLAVGFALLTAGTIALRSGISKAFKAHWVIQAVAGTAIIVGCILGIKLSFDHGSKFATLHQRFGLLIIPWMLIQAYLGYKHHINFVKLGRRTAVSNYHVWAGRIVLLGGNLNVGLGFQLASATPASYFIWYMGLATQAALLIAMWCLRSKGKSFVEVVRKDKASKQTEQYQPVDQNAFVVGDDAEYELDDEELGKKELNL